MKIGKKTERTNERTLPPSYRLRLITLFLPKTLLSRHHSLAATVNIKRTKCEKLQKNK